MPLRHALLGLAVVAIWGTNFVVIARGLAEIPPFAFATLRFLFAALPWVFVLPRPAVPWSRLAAFGVLVGAGQFGMLFLALDGHLSPGLASLLLQAQVPFTVLLTALLHSEPVRLRQALALPIALAGIALVGWQASVHPASTVTTAGLALALVAALAWAAANTVVRASGRVEVVPFMAWSSLFAVPPLALLSLAFDPPGALREVWHTAGAVAWAAVAWQVFANTLFGFGAWNWLLARHPAATVTPLALLVPVFGLSASALLLGEGLPSWKLEAAALVIGGVALNLWASRARTAAPAAAAASTRRA